MVEIPGVQALKAPPTARNFLVVRSDQHTVVLALAACLCTQGGEMPAQPAAAPVARHATIFGEEGLASMYH